MMRRSQPGPVGLYDPRFEHDACGVSFVVDIKGRASRRIVDLAIGALCNLEHRGATGAEPDTGDGAGILLQVPDRFLREVVGFPLPPAGHYAVGLCFLPTDEVAREKTVAAIERLVAEEGLQTVGWRDVPVEPDVLGESARQVLPVMRQLFLADPAGMSGLALDQRIYPLRKRIEHEVDDEALVADGPSAYFPSLSARTIVYKGMLTTRQLGAFYPDLTDERVESALALVHSRFSTNTLPS
jgi:glutamate synthase (NADPH) large chain